jgi:predicted esterase
MRNQHRNRFPELGSIGLWIAIAIASACSSEPLNTGDAGPLDAAAPQIDAEQLPPSSGGAGGIFCNETVAIGDRTVCVAEAGGSEFRFVEPTPGNGPLRLIIHAHGDGARTYRDDSAITALLPWADAHHALVVAVQSPNGCAWWQKPSQTDCSGNTPSDSDYAGVNADALKAVMDLLRSRYDVALQQNYFYGVSGGSIFLTHAFLRRYGNQYPGVYALQCGGQRPGMDFMWDVSDATERSVTKLYFTYGDRDFLKSYIEAAIPFFMEVGFPVDQTVVPGATHCDFDLNGRTLEVFSDYVGQM